MKKMNTNTRLIPLAALALYVAFIQSLCTARADFVYPDRVCTIHLDPLEGSPLTTCLLGDANLNQTAAEVTASLSPGGATYRNLQSKYNSAISYDGPTVGTFLERWRTIAEKLRDYQNREPTADLNNCAVANVIARLEEAASKIDVGYWSAFLESTDTKKPFKPPMIIWTEIDAGFDAARRRINNIVSAANFNPISDFEELQKEIRGIEHQYDSLAYSFEVIAGRLPQYWNNWSSDYDDFETWLNRALILIPPVPPAGIYSAPPGYM